jgi:ligand-binding SRPBCC domain-containing protein
VLAADRAQVWRSVTSLAGLRREMMPMLAMTAPPGVESLTDLPLTPGQPLFHSRLLLGGFIPAGTSALTLLSLEPGSGFVEQSPMTGMAQWRHQRRLTDAGSGCRVTDTLEFEPKFLSGVTAALIHMFFNHRHRRLRRQFGQMP